MAERTWNDETNTECVNFTPSEKLRAEPEKLQDKDVDTVFITDSDIKHINKQHGQNEGKRGQVDITSEDISLIPFVMNEFESVSLVETDKLGNKKILFKKQINGTACVTIIERRQHKEQILTLWSNEYVIANYVRSQGTEKEYGQLEKIKDDTQPSLFD